jgi:hypothetical protein
MVRYFVLETIRDLIIDAAKCSTDFEVDVHKVNSTRTYYRKSFVSE